MADPLFDPNFRCHIFDVPGGFHLELVEKDTGLACNWWIDGGAARQPGFIDMQLRSAIRERRHDRREEAEALALDQDC